MIEQRVMKYALIMTLVIMISMTSTTAYTHTSGIETNDEVRMTYVLTVDGKVEDSSNSFDTVVSSSYLIEGFYEGLLGMKVWESQSFMVLPSKGYSTGDLAGKNLYFEVSIIEITKNIRDGGRVTSPPPEVETTTDPEESGYLASGSVLEDIISSPVFKMVGSISIIIFFYVMMTRGKPPAA